MRFTKWFIVSFMLLGGLLPWNATAINASRQTSSLAQNYASNLIEELLAKTLMQIQQGETQRALETVNELIRTMPNFKLAYLIRGDLLASHVKSLTGFGDVGQIDQDAVKDYQEEARIRLTHYLDKNKYRLFPNLLVQPAASQRYVIVVDTSKSRLYLYARDEMGQFKYMADYYVTIGKNGVGKQLQGDKRTPLGVYFASTRIQRPLPDMYGPAAYPLNYPNEIDTFLNKKGNGIWLHGTPTDTYSRPPRASDGCVVLSNPDIEALAPILSKGNTPVIIVDSTTWTTEDFSKNRDVEKTALAEALEQWRRDWVSQNSTRYLEHYAKDFFFDGGDLSNWSAYKRRIQASKPKVKIDVANVSMFSYPNDKRPMVVVEFEQTFESAHLKNTMKKRQYWVNENHHWKIFYEGAA